MQDSYRLACLLSQTSLDSSSAVELRKLANSSTDWNYLLQFSIVHRVFPLFYKNLEEYCLDSAPSDVLRQLEGMCLQNDARNWVHLNSLFTVHSLFSQADIGVIYFKGPILSKAVFGDVYLRIYGDIDFLVARDDLYKSLEILIGAGFTIDIDLNKAQYKKLLAKTHQAVLLKDHSVIELHWELSGRYFSRSVTFESVYPGSREIELEGTRVRTLGAEDLLVYLCIHGCRHYWEQLDSVCCINELVRQKKGWDWMRVVKIAQQQGALKMLVLGVLLAHQLFDLAIPAEITTALKRHPQLFEVATSIERKFFQISEYVDQRLSFWQSVRYNYVIMDRFSDCVRYSLRPIFNATHSDWQWFALPAHLSSLYTILRPVRLLKKYTIRMFNRSI